MTETGKPVRKITVTPATIPVPEVLPVPEPVKEPEREKTPA